LPEDWLLHEALVARSERSIQKRASCFFADPDDDTTKARYCFDSLSLSDAVALALCRLPKMEETGTIVAKWPEV
jgi:hypothetical protein